MVKSENKSFYVPLDGLRALCFLSVFFFHCNISGFQIGWAGVSIFFTISGFLITEILIRARHSRTYFKSFYLRRSLRIFPIYYLYIFIATTIFLLVKKQFPNDFFYYIFYVPNFQWIFTNYVSDLQLAMAHIWSLAIEEQFYLLWPALVYFLPLRLLSSACFVCIIGAILFRSIFIYVDNCFYCRSILLPSQIDLLAFGGLLACYKNSIVFNQWIKWLIKKALVIGGISIFLIIMLVGLKETNNIVNGYGLMQYPEKYLNNIFTGQIFFFWGLFSVGVIKMCFENRTFFTRKILSHPIFISIGKRSYGLYLYHWPIILVVKHFVKNKSIVMLLSLTVTYFIAWLSYRFIEKYFNNLKRKFEY